MSMTDQARAALQASLALAREKGYEPDDTALLAFDADDSGNAAALEYVLKDRYLENNAYGWLRWTGTHFETEGAEAALTNDVKKVLIRRRKAAVSDSRYEPVVRAAVPSARHVRDAIALFKPMQHEPVSAFDKDLHLLNVTNGVLDLRTGTLAAHETSQRFTYALNTPYAPDADRSVFTGLLHHAIGGGEEVVMWLQAWLGYCLTGETNLEQLLYIHGPTRSGKGTLTETLLALLGKTARSVDFTSFTAKREADTQNFDLAPLKAARLVIASESNQGAELNAAKIKGITGGDEVTCAFKHRDVFTYRPQFKVVLVSNHPLNVDVDDDAAWTRVRVVVFPHSHAGSEDYTLKKRMRSEDVLRGTLAWLVEGARRYYTAGRHGIPTPPAVLAATRLQREALDYVQQWLDARTIRAPSAITPTGVLWKDYEAWCRDNGATPRHINRFSKSLSQKGLQMDRTKTARVVKGLGLQT
jgi:putative DNA primase/helicase